MPVKPPAGNLNAPSPDPRRTSVQPGSSGPGKAPLPNQTPTKVKGPGLTAKDVGMGLGCLVIVGLFILYVVTGVQRFFTPPRPVNLKPVIRETRTAEEKKVRKEWERYALSAAWQGDQAQSMPLEKKGPEIRPGVSRFDFCNRSGTNLRLYFDGTEIFMVQVPDGDSVAIEFKSGLYDLLIVAPKFRDNTVVAPFYQRVKLEGVYHDLFQLHGAGPVKPCPDRHEPIRRLP